jgi:hypothetical protein
LTFEIKPFEKGYWEKASEQDVLEILHESFDLIAPVFEQMLEGKSILTTKGICRVKKEALPK